MAEFQNKVAIVKGGTSGISRAPAVAYARKGATVVVAGRRAAEGEETVQLVQVQGAEGIFVATDVSKAARAVIKHARWLLLRNRENIRKREDRVRLDELLAANRKLLTVYVVKDDLKHLW